MLSAGRISDHLFSRQSIHIPPDFFCIRKARQTTDKVEKDGCVPSTQLIQYFDLTYIRLNKVQILIIIIKKSKAAKQKAR